MHSQETERLGGVTRDAPKPFHFRDGGGDLLVKLTGHHPGWTNTSGGQKVRSSPMPLKPFRNIPESATVQPWTIRGNLTKQTRQTKPRGCKGCLHTRIANLENTFTCSLTSKFAVHLLACTIRLEFDRYFIHVSRTL